MNSFAISNNNHRLKYDSKIQSTITFSSPLLDEGYPTTVIEYRNGTLHDKPLLVYLPGFDGTLLAPFLQFPELGTEFEVWGMSVSMEDRSTVKNLCDQVVQFIIEKLKSNHRRKIYVMGESFGGILAIEVSLAIAKYNSTILGKNKGLNMGGVVLINPATCYNTSNLAKLGPNVAEGSSLLYPFKLLSMLPLFTDEYALPQLMKILQGEGLPSVIDTPAREAYMGRVAFSLPSKLKYMPQETLKWRLNQWLTKGCDLIQSKEEEIKYQLSNVPVLIIVGEKDNTLPSVSESQRLKGILGSTKTDVHVVKGAGHACTCGSRVDLTSLMRRKFLQDSSTGRQEMKSIASNTSDEYFGLEPRYDGKKIGLSPLKYWSSEYYFNNRNN